MSAEIVHHDDVVWLKAWGQDLLDIGQERIAVHRAVDDTGCGKRACAQAGDEGRRLPVAVRDFADQPFAAGRPAAQSRHVGAGAGFVDEDQTLRIELGLTLHHAARATATSGRSCSAARTLFFKADAVAIEEPPDRADPRLLLTFIEQAALDLFQRQIGLLPRQISSHSSCRLSGERLCPLMDLASTLPVSRHRFTQRIAVASPITNCRAAARAAIPFSTTWITRTRKSFE